VKLAGLGSGAALVPVSPVPDWCTWCSGGPITHGNANVIGNKAQDVYPGAGLANDLENEPGALWAGRPFRFYENGVMTPMNGFGDAATSTGITSMPPMRLSLTSSIGATTAMALGAGMGAYLSERHRPLGAVIGALTGGILGLVFGG